MVLIDLSLLLFIVFILIWILVTYRFGDWRNWRVYYPTILFFWCGNLIGFMMFHHYPLWEFKSNVLDHTSIELLQMVFIFTCTTILFLQYYPKKIIKKITYISLWVFIYSLIEWIFHLLGGITYNNGWSIWWSVTHNIYQFVLLRIHHKNPIIAWVFSVIILVIAIVIFKIA